MFAGINIQNVIGSLLTINFGSGGDAETKKKIAQIENMLIKNGESEASEQIKQLQSSLEQKPNNETAVIYAVASIPNESKFWVHLKEILKNRKETIFMMHSLMAEYGESSNSLSSRFMDCVNGMIVKLEEGRNVEAISILHDYMKNRMFESVNFNNTLRNSVSNIMGEFDEKGTVSREIISDALHQANQLHMQSAGMGIDNIQMVILEAKISSESGMLPVMYEKAETESKMGGITLGGETMFQVVIRAPYIQNFTGTFLNCKWEMGQPVNEDMDEWITTVKYDLYVPLPNENEKHVFGSTTVMTHGSPYTHDIKHIDAIREIVASVEKEVQDQTGNPDINVEWNWSITD